MLSEFKEFIKRGNVLEFAVAVIMATAFGAVVTTFTQDVLMPPIGYAMGGVEFDDLKVLLQDGTPEIKNAAGEITTAAVPEVAIRWGKWVKTIFDFLVISFILFLIVRAYNNVNPPPEPGPTQEELLTEIRDLLRK